MLQQHNRKRQCSTATPLRYIQWLHRRRFAAVGARLIQPQDFALGESPVVPASVTLPNRNYMNLLEVPVLFYVVCLTYYLTRQVSGIALALAWTFDALRGKGIREARDMADLGAQWQRAFPSARQVPIRRIENDTVYAEIHTPCPLRGTGDVHACYRMMEFDREVLKRAGGQFVVLRSQSEPGRTGCEVAMRRAGAPVSDLVSAHERVKP